MSDFKPIEIPIEIPTEQLMRDAERLANGLGNVDASVASAQAKFQGMAKEQLKNGVIIGDVTKTTKQYTSTLELLQKRLEKTQNPKLAKAYANAIAAVKKETEGVANASGRVNVATSRFNGLGNSINQITRDLPAFTYGVQMGFMAISNNIPILADEIERLSARNKELKASGQSTVPVWKSLVKNIFSWQTAMSVGILMLTVFGKEIGKWINGLTKGNKAVNQLKESRKALKDAFKSTEVKKAATDIAQLTAKIKAAKKGFYDKKKALDEYNKSLGKTVGKARSLSEAEDWLNKNKDKYIKMMVYKAAATKLMEKATDDLIKIQQEKIKPLDEHRSWTDNFTAAAAKGKSKGYLESLKAYDQSLKKSAYKNLEEKTKKINKHYKEESKVIENLYNEAKKLSDQLGIKFTKTLDTEEKAYEQLTQRILDIDKEYAQKSMSSDQQELQALRDKFDKIRKEVEKFNKNPKNTIKIDAGKLDKAQANAEQSLKYKQHTEWLKKQLETEKQMYAAYEEYKQELGEATAKQMYGNLTANFSNYGELLEMEISKLNSQIAASDDEPTPEATERLTFLYKEQAKWLNERSSREKKLFAEAYQASVTYEENTLQLKRNYEQKKQALQGIDNRELREQKQAELQAQYQADLDAERSAAYEKTKIYEELSQNLVGITRRELENRINSLREYLKAAKGNLTDSQKDFIKAELAKAEAIKKSTDTGTQEAALLQRKAELHRIIADKKIKGLTNITAEREELERINGELSNIIAKKASNIASKASQLGGAFRDLGQSLKGVDEGTADTVETMGELLEVAADVGSAIASFASGDIIGGITKTIGAVTKVFAIGAKARESERKALEEIKKWHDKIFEGQLAYNEELRNRIVEEVKLNDLYKSRLANIKEEIEANKKAKQSLIEDQNAVFERLLKSKTVVDKYTKKYGGFLGIGRKTKVVNVTRTIEELLRKGYDGNRNSSFLGGIVKKKFTNLFPDKKEFEGSLKLTDELFEKLRKINRDKPLTGDAKEAYEQLKKIRDEYGSLEKAQRELEKQRKDAVVGFTAQSIADSIIEGVKQGKKSFADFAGDIEGLLRQSIIAGMSAKIIEPEMQKLQDMLYGMLGDGVLSGEEKKEWQEAYMKVAKSATEYTKMMKEAGISIAGTTNNANSLKGAVKGITEAQADLLSGQFGGLRLTQLETNNILKYSFARQLELTSKSVAIQLEIEKNTRRTAKNTEKLHGINDGLKGVEKAVKQNYIALQANGL